MVHDYGNQTLKRHAYPFFGFFYPFCVMDSGSPSGGFFEQTGHNEVQQPF